jgi:hypothetical protein
MKTSILIVIVLITTALFSNAQEADTLKNTSYGLEVSQFITGSGFASGTEIYLTMLHDKKTLSLGLFYCPDQKKISGITLHHEVALVRNPSQRIAVPYAFYNMIYRFTHTEMAVPEEKYDGLYKSFEHHFGIGLNVGISRHLQVKCGLGYGVYFGSIAKPSVDSFTGEVTGSNGFGAIGKLGFIYIF